MSNLIKKVESMSDGQIRNEVSKQIARGTMRKRKLENVICYLEKNNPSIFNDDANGFVLNNNRSQWDKEYLRKIHNAIICGYFCRKILFHMQRVSSKLLLKYKLASFGIGIVFIGFIIFLISLAM